MRKEGYEPGSGPRRLSLLALSILAGINLLNYLDRYVVAALLPDLKQAPMRLTDSELGSLMSGFLIVYLLAAPIFGRLGDRGSRPKPIAIGVFLWSLATGLSGLARSYLQLLGARAFAIFNMAIPVGAALGYIVGGIVRQRFDWHVAFFVAGVPGVLLAVWILKLPDPPRGAKDEGGTDPRAVAHGAPQPGSWSVYLRLLRQRPY